jgi:hypothetical protein
MDSRLRGNDNLKHASFSVAGMLKKLMDAASQAWHRETAIPKRLSALALINYLERFKCVES